MWIFAYVSNFQDNETWVICIFLEPFIYLLLWKFLLDESVNEYTVFLDVHHFLDELHFTDNSQQNSSYG